MKNAILAVSLGIILCFAFGCQKAEEAAEEPAVDIEAETEIISKLTKDWFAAELQHDMEASLSFLAPDAVVHMEGAPAIVGTAALRALYEEVFKIPFTDWVLEPRTVVVSTSGDLAYDIGSFKMVIEGPEGRREEPQKSTIIWRKLENQWKVVVCCFSNDSPQAPASEES